MSESTNGHGADGDAIRPAGAARQPESIVRADGTIMEEEVFERELSEIVKRRTQLRSVEDEPKRSDHGANGRGGNSNALESQRLSCDRKQVSKELVGLSLSGGGVRSASFSIGLLQAFGSTGLMKYVDYLSTVSGGGYTGALYSSQALACADTSADRLWKRLHPFANEGECKYDDAKCPLKSVKACAAPQLNELLKKGSDSCRRPAPNASGNRDDGQQNELIRRLAYGGDYLFRDKAEFTIRYIGGLLFNNLVLFSALIATCALLAWLWRWMDATQFSDYVLKPLSTYATFSWMPWSWSDERLRPFLPLLLIPPIWLVMWIVVRRASRRATAMLGKAMLLACITCALIGVAIVLGNRDIAGADRFWDWQNSIYPWLVMAGGLLPFIRPRLLLDSAIRPKNQVQSYIFMIASTTLLVGVPFFGVFWFGREDFAKSAERRVVISERDLIVPDRLSKLVDLSMVGMIATREIAPFASIIEHRAPASDHPPLLWRSPNATDPSERELARHQRLQPIADAIETRFRIAIGRSFLTAWESRTAKDSDASGKGTTISEWTLNNESRKAHLKWLGEVFTRMVEAAELPHSVGPVSASSFIELAEARADTQLRTEWDELKEDKRAIQRQYYDKGFLRKEIPRLRELLARFQRYGTVAVAADGTALPAIDGRLNPGELRELNRMLLNAWYPAYFQPRAFISTAQVVGVDQWHRFWWFVTAAGICLVASYFVDPNWTSVQGYYRDRLTNSFVVPTAQDGREIRMSHLSTCEKAAPYHLISGTATLKTFRNALGLRDPDAAHDLEIFLFSKLYCGSRTLRYAPAGSCLPTQCDTLGNAIAVSGAAVSPDAVNDLLVRSVMTVLNLRQGQWLPNPGQFRRIRGDGRHAYWKPSYLSLALGLGRPIRKHPLCFVTDGGHRENLGLVQLLLRRCRLIIASDAGCDPAHRFDDLARALRICDLHLGIRFEEIVSQVDKKHSAQTVGRASELQSEPLDLYTVRRTGEEGVLPQSDPKITSARERREKNLVERHFLFARIIYPDRDEPGLLVYLKPSLNGDESEAIENYRASHPEFPHESTIDQDYDPAQFMSYLMLGQHIGQEVATLFEPEQANNDMPRNWWQTEATSIKDLVIRFFKRVAPKDEDKQEFNAEEPGQTIA
jgi:hypothetical protein